MRSTSYGWLGILIMVAGLLLIRFTEWAFIHYFFTPWMWTGYLLFADALVARRRGSSWLTPRPGLFLALLPTSLFLWLLFEGYNLHLRNWQYIGLPSDPLVETLGYMWAFATIWPAIFVTADLLEVFGVRLEGKPLRVTPGRLRGWFTAGLLMAVIPLLLPAHIATYTFAIVWLAFVFLFEPLLYSQTGVRSLLREAEQGQWTRWISLAASGLVCGLLWESWNMLAGAKWVYIFPLFQNIKLFEMPLPGFIGFIPFAWETSAMYSFSLLVRGSGSPGTGQSVEGTTGRQAA